MARVRTRPTREETRARLFDAAAKLFSGNGIGATSIEAIAAEAGLTRGAVYSNFAGKDELILAMLEEHSRRSLRHHREVLAHSAEPTTFLDALRAAEGTRRGDPVGSSPLLHMELILFVARSRKRRPELARRLQARRALMREMVVGVNRAAGADHIDADWAAEVLLALEDGYRLHSLIDPAAGSDESFTKSVRKLQRLLY